MFFWKDGLHSTGKKVASTTGNIRILHYLERSKQKNLTKTPRTWVQWRVLQYISVYSIKFSNLFWTVLLHLFSFSIFLQCQSLFPFSFIRDPFNKEWPFPKSYHMLFFFPKVCIIWGDLDYDFTSMVTFHPLSWYLLFYFGGRRWSIFSWSINCLIDLTVNPIICILSPVVLPKLKRG